MERSKVFVSYSRQDRPWLERLLAHLAVLERKKLIHVWSDIRIQVGDVWEQEIEQAMGESKIAVLLISTGFLSSKFIWDKEVPKLKQHQDQGMEILPLITKPCAWRLEEWLAALEARPLEGRPLSMGSDVQVDLDLTAFAYELAERVQESDSGLAAEERERAEQLRMAAPTQSIPLVSERTAGVSTGQPPTSVLQSPGNTEERGLSQTWNGVYFPDSEFSLIISKRSNGKLGGEIHYSRGQTKTKVEGSFWEDVRILVADRLWSSISNASSSNVQLALRFRETGYVTQGSRDIKFDGEYRAFVHGDSMSGAWFSNQSSERPIGFFELKREQ